MFSLVFFHISIIVLNGLLKLTMNITIILLLFLLTRRRFCVRFEGVGWEVLGRGAMTFFTAIALLFKIYRQNSFLE